MKEKIKGLLMVLLSISMLSGGMYLLDGIEGFLFVWKMIGTMIALFTICIIGAKGCVKLFH